MRKTIIRCETSSIIEEVYRTITGNKNNFGVFHKCLFHIHTSASYDYWVVENEKISGEQNGKTYKEFSEKDIYALCVKNGVFTDDMLINDFGKDKEEFKIFSDAKEAMMFLLIAFKLFENGIELAVISDHNTISGYEKLKKAISLIGNKRSFGIYPTLLLGLEISCADKIHVVGIFNNTPKIKEKINAWIEDNIMSTKDGTFATSLEVMKWIDSCGGVPYLAHVNSSDMFKEEKFLTGAYKKQLFNSSCFNVVGLSEKNKKTIIERKLAEHSKREFCFVLDSDSHSIDTIGDKIFWIKGSNCSFGMIKSAFRDYGISIEHEAPKEPDKFVKGILIENEDRGFLKDKKVGKNFCLSFSNALNCFIGGRGTGKSTILNIIEVMLSQKFPSVEMLEAMCEYYAIWVLFYCQGKEYLISFLSPEKTNSAESFVMYFDKKRNYNFGRMFENYKNEIAEYTLDNYIEIYKICSNRKPITYTKIKGTEKRNYLNEFFNRGYSINELVQTASSDAIHNYILKTMKFDEMLTTQSEKFRSIAGLKSHLVSIRRKMINRKSQVLAEIELFNERQNGKLRITYNQKSDDCFLVDFEKILKRGRYGKRMQYYGGHNISVERVADFLHQACKLMTTPELFLALIQKEYEKINAQCSIIDFCNEYTATMVENGVIRIDDKTYNDVLDKIQVELMEDQNTLDEIIMLFRNYIRRIEEFDLEFNIYNKEDLANHEPVYRKIKMLSLGQKVVAMLSFILGYSDFSKDYRPLLIDQPEDNLDSRYIFKNLVADLREVKAKRQVIIATHNATIVTNAKADQVIVMESDGLNGWVLASGFPNETSIKRHIINYLEGGVESFEHKCFIYEEIFKR